MSATREPSAYKRSTPVQPRSTSQCGFFDLHAFVNLLCAATCFIVIGILLAFVRTEATAQVSNRTLTFEEPVSYQRDIEDANAGFTFTPGHFYSASYGFGGSDIYEYSETGTFLSSITPQSLIPGDELRGIAFGPDGLLYAVKMHFAESGFNILALDSSGNVHVTYAMDDINVRDDSGYGKIAFDRQHIYVAGGTDLVRFIFGNPNSGVSIYSNNGIIDVKALPNGHLFVAWAYGVDEITNTGTIVRSIPLIGANWSNIQGIEYDPIIDKLFATQIGDFLLMRINASTGALEKFVNLSYGNDLFLTQSNTLLVGSYTQPPGMFDENLTSIGSLGTEERVFVTQYAACTGRCIPAPRPRPVPRRRPRSPH